MFDKLCILVQNQAFCLHIAISFDVGHEFYDSLWACAFQRQMPIAIEV